MTLATRLIIEQNSIVLLTSFVERSFSKFVVGRVQRRFKYSACVLCDVRPAAHFAMNLKLPCDFGINLNALKIRSTRRRCRLS